MTPQPRLVHAMERPDRPEATWKASLAPLPKSRTRSPQAEDWSTYRLVDADTGGLSLQALQNIIGAHSDGVPAGGSRDTECGRHAIGRSRPRGRRPTKCSGWESHDPPSVPLVDLSNLVDANPVPRDFGQEVRRQPCLDRLDGERRPDDLRAHTQDIGVGV